MGTVWRARDEVLARQVAVKRLHVSPQLDADELALRHERTTREAQAAARINHPNVVSVHDVVLDDGLPCIVMEYVPAGTLGDLIKQAARENRFVDPREAARIGRGMIAALRAAHAAGVLHRDVKPGNVLLGDEGRVVLTDFGIAVASGTSTLTKTGELVGSIDYLAPERVKGGTPGPASDLWALGATLYQAVEGRPPFRKTTAVESAYAIAVDPLEPPAHAGPLAPLIEALLEKEPGDRPTAEVVEQALRTAEAEVDTALIGWPTLALGTVGRGSDTASGSEALTRPVVPSDTTGGGRSARGNTGTGATTGITGRPGGTGAVADPRIAASLGSPAAGTDTTTADSAATGTTGRVTGAVAATRGLTEVEAEAKRVAEADTGSLGGSLLPAANRATVAGADETGPVALTPPPRKRRGRVVLWCALGVLATGGGAGGAWYALHGTGGTGQPATSDTPGRPPATERPVGPPPRTPDGMHRVEERELGVSYPVPDGWTRQVKDGGRQIVYISQASLAQLTISVLDFSSGDQVAHFKQVEADLQKEYPSYSRKRLQDTMYQNDPAAIWEFTFQGKARQYHGIDLGFGREGEKEYAIYVSAPSADWARFSDLFSKVKDGFRKSEDAS
ncbi:serine/threonine-protein kinase [Streptomyces catenulae]|uniref:non-specific serine/threonine protein kinase n=1 Tax=Streptomyces catenulae TaxID=66875 RepID=A0ABV2YU71_9ACTN|nr:serine/threonine-protein kinase [Streptomyces catenulae]